MKANLEEHHYRQLFHKLKQEDERHAPSFDRTWQSAASRGKRPCQVTKLWRVVVASAALIILGTAVTLFRHRSKSAPLESSIEQSALLISQWESSTDFLLTTTSSVENALSIPQANQ
jgi:type VI protein secretion system component VasF